MNRTKAIGKKYKGYRITQTGYDWYVWSADSNDCLYCGWSQADVKRWVDAQPVAEPVNPA